MLLITKMSDNETSNIDETINNTLITTAQLIKTITLTDDKDALTAILKDTTNLDINEIIIDNEMNIIQFVLDNYKRFDLDWFTFVVEKLISHDVCINKKYEDGTPILFIIIKTYIVNKLDIENLLKLLIEKHVDLSITNDEDDNLLLYILKYISDTLDLTLLNANISKTQHNTRGSFMVECIKKIIKHVDVDKRDTYGDTPLIVLLTYNHNSQLYLCAIRELVNYLIDNGATINLKNNHEFTALWYSMEMSRIMRYNKISPCCSDISYDDIIIDLLNRGANPTILWNINTQRYEDKNEKDMITILFGTNILCYDIKVYELLFSMHEEYIRNNFMYKYNTIIKPLIRYNNLKKIETKYNTLRKEIDDCAPGKGEIFFNAMNEFNSLANK